MIGELALSRRARGLCLLACVTAAGLAQPPAGLRAAGSDRSATLAVYAGVGSWVDIFARWAWAHPAQVVHALEAHGATTLYLQTSNYSQAADIVDPAAVGRLLDDAHASGLKVVAWYLPSFAQPRVDLRRAEAALHFRSRTGQTFDSFALDIEATAEKNLALRDARLLGLARSLRTAAPAGYPLGAIVPSPVGMRRHPRFWPRFPFEQLGRIVDAFLPMAYFSYYATNASDAYAYAHEVITTIRRSSDRSDVPIQVIGGIANRMRAGTLQGFLRAVAACGVDGISLYAFLETDPAQWARVSATPLGSPPTSACLPQAASP